MPVSSLQHAQKNWKNATSSFTAKAVDFHSKALIRQMTRGSD
jgi:hypothetical protein